MAYRITNYADAFSLIGIDDTPKLREFIKNLEKEGHTEKSICFSIWKQQDKLRNSTSVSGFLWILKNEILKYSWPKGDIRWQNYWDKKNEQKKATSLLEKQRREFLSERKKADDLYRKEQETRKAQGYIYFIQGQCGGAIKIGFSYQPAERLKSLQTGYPDTLTILSMIPGSLDLERELHEEFSYCKLNGEWFKPDQRLLDKINKQV